MHYGPTAAIEVLTDLPPTPSLRPARPTPSLRRGQSAHCSLLTVPYALLITHWRALLTAHHSLLTVPYSLFRTHCSSLIGVHCSLLTTHCSLFLTHCSVRTAHHSLACIAHCSPLTAHCSLLTAPYALLSTHWRALLTAHLSLFLTHCSSLIGVLISHWRALPTVPYALLSTYWRSLLTAHHSLLITHSRLQVEVRAGAESFGKGNRRRMRFGALLRKARRPLLTCAHLASAVPTCLRTVRAWGAGPLVQGPPCCSTGRSSGAAPLGQGLEPRAEPGVLLSAPWHHHRWRRVRRNTI